MYYGMLVASTTEVMVPVGACRGGAVGKLSDVKDALVACGSGWHEYEEVNAQLEKQCRYEVDASTMKQMWAKLEGKGWVDVSEGRARVRPD